MEKRGISQGSLNHWRVQHLDEVDRGAMKGITTAKRI
jgi:hypothetical protein